MSDSGGATAGEFETIRYETSADKVATITLDRPQVLNAFDRQMCEEMRTAWRLGGLDELAHLNLRKWAHMLGFRGHFLTKSRRYSTTFTALRQVRAAWRLDQHRAALGIDDDTTITVVGDWTFTGIGYRNDAERVMAALYAEAHLARANLDGQDDAGPPEWGQ